MEWKSLWRVYVEYDVGQVVVHVLGLVCVVKFVEIKSQGNKKDNGLPLRVIIAALASSLQKMASISNSRLMIHSG